MTQSIDLHTVDTAPDASKPLLEKSQKAYGMIPNLHGAMAESPEILDAYQKIGTLFGAGTLSATERDVIWLTAARENHCEYCVPAHTWIAKSNKTPEDVIEALRTGGEIADAKLNALAAFTREVTVNRGQVSAATEDAFYAAGYTKQQAFEVLIGVAHKTLSNYANHLFDIPVDAPFAAFAWTPEQAAAE